MEERDRERLADLELAYLALAALVRGEYPTHNLFEIASTWGPQYGVTNEQAEALKRLEAGQ